MNDSGEVYNILRVACGGPSIIQSPAALPTFDPETFFRVPSAIHPTSVAGEGSDTPENADLDEEQPLLIDTTTEAISQSNGSEGSVESRDQYGCWKSFMAWLYVLFATLLRRSSNESSNAS